ncbi:MAG: hypothetical protein PHI13_11385 [Methylococcales bacterium]|nr:hypothetical protein [Methylococcales bacterium]
MPNRSTFRETLIRVDPEQLDIALQGWNDQFAEEDEGLVIDGKTLCNALDEAGRQAHILGFVGPRGRCHTKKSQRLAHKRQRCAFNTA